MGPSEVAKVAPPSSGGLYPRIARAEVLLDGRRFERARCPLYHPGGLTSPHIPLRSQVHSSKHQCGEVPEQQMRGTSPHWWAVQDLNLRPHPCQGCALAT